MTRTTAKQTVIVRLSPEDDTTVRQIAKATSKSVGSVVRQLVAEALKVEA